MTATGALAVVAVGFVAVCLVDILRRPQPRSLPRWAWALIVCVSIPIGGIVYLAVGRARRNAHPPDDLAPPLVTRAPAAPSSVAGGPIDLVHLTKRFGSTVAVDDLTFTVRPGRVSGFLGPNGAGKTTTMRVLLGLQAPTSGTALVHGRRYVDLDQPLLEVGSLLDADAVHPGRTARLHVLAVAQSNGIGARRADEVLGLTGIAAVADRRVGTFSLGMRQRLGLAVALLGDPPIVVLDEPINGLDPEGIRWCRELCRSLATEGRTVLVSSHVMSEMAQLADHLVIIGRGRLLADTPTEAFIAANAHHDVFVRSPDADTLGPELVRAGATLVPEGHDAFAVSGLTAPAIADVAAARRLAIHELTPRHASLEQAYLDLTEASVDFRSATGTKAQPARSAE